VVECFLKTFDKSRISAIIGDREFIGRHWLDNLLFKQIPYIFRAKEEGQYISNARGEMIKINPLFYNLKAGESVNLGKRKIGKTDFVLAFVTAARSNKGELIVLIHSEDIANPLELYKERWGIETMFRGFKTAGFNLEATHLTHYDRLYNLLCVMAIAYCIAYQIGEITIENKTLIIKSHGYAAKSTFRIGLDEIKHAIINRAEKYSHIKWLTTKIASYTITGLQRCQNFVR